MSNPCKIIFSSKLDLFKATCTCFIINYYSKMFNSTGPWESKVEKLLNRPVPALCCNAAPCESYISASVLCGTLAPTHGGTSVPECSGSFRHSCTTACTPSYSELSTSLPARRCTPLHTPCGTGPGTNVIRLFTVVIYRWARLFLPDRPFRPCLMFVDRAGDKDFQDKHYSLIDPLVNYERKKIYNIGPCSSNSHRFLEH
jgi:hypothetical protein